MRAGALNLLVFREGRRPVSGPELKETLRQQLKEMEGTGGEGKVLNALLRAGELECAVADDANAPPRAYEDLTDRLAETLVASRFDLDLRALQQELDRAPVSEELSVATPEGFAYYALHPLAYAEVLEKMPFLRGSVVAVGIRSIGTTLSAVSAAAARARGLNAQRITVRPCGHPYNRHTEFSVEQFQFIQRAAASDATFLIVDEGPGLSGSSFLSVAEALVSCSVLPERIFMVCGREPDFDTFRAHDGPRRARRFRWIAVSPEPRRPAAAHLFVGAGEWRHHALREGAHWPACWTTFERLKYLSPADNGRRRLFKFLGLGHYGEQVVEREQRVADAGFGPAVQSESESFASYPWMTARPMRAADLSELVLERLASYCFFRSQAFPGTAREADALQEMAMHNLEELKVAALVDLRVERSVLADGRMQPHEWLLDARGQMLKTDSGSHGDDHFFPGLTDIAWDLAGTIVEWRMNAAQAQAFLEAYRRQSGDDAARRIDGFVVAYVVFRRAYCLMAANALQGSDEQSRLEAAAEGYAKVLDTLQSSSFANRR
jgi:hypothetical protein